MTDTSVIKKTPEIASRLNEERTALRAFILLLEKEQQALLNQGAEQLMALAESKILAAHKLTDMANARRQLLNIASEHTDTTSWIQKNAPACCAVWEEIRELADRIHHLNQTNGEVIQLKLRSNQQALGVLLGAAKGTAGLYGRDGQPSLGITGRTLGSG